MGAMASNMGAMASNMVNASFSRRRSVFLGGSMDSFFTSIFFWGGGGV